MSQLGRIDYTFLDGSGNPVVGASVEVRRQGAQIKTGGPNVFTVDDPGGLLVNDNTVLNSSSSTVRAVTAVGATSVTVGAGGFTPTVDDDRISVASPLATIYSDAVGTDTKDNPLTTDNKGRVVCYAVGGKYDLLATAPPSYGLSPQLIQDVVAEGAETWKSNVFPTGAAVAWQFDTSRALIAGDKAFRVLSAGLELFNIDYAGSARILGNATVLGAGGLTVAGTITGTGGLAITGSGAFSTFLTVGTTLGVSGVATMAGITNTGTITSTSDITATASNAVARRFITGGQATAHVAGDWALSAGWGTTANVSSILGNDLRGFMRIASSGTGQGANPIATLTFKDGAFPSPVPKYVMCRGAVGNQLTLQPLLSSPSATQLSFTFPGTPAAGESYEFFWVGIG